MPPAPALFLTRFSLRYPVVVVATTIVLCMVLGWGATRISGEVGYSAYFGPDHPEIRHLSEFLREFDSGLHILLAFSCAESEICDGSADPTTLRVLGEIQAELDSLPNVRRTLSVLNTPILIGPFEVRTLAETNGDDRFVLRDDWEMLLLKAQQEPFLTHTVLAPNGQALGLVVELQSLQSAPLQDLVHAILERVPAYEAKLGADIYLAGDPIWTVVSDDDLNADSQILTVLMFVVIIGVLWGLFRNLWLTLLPVLSVGVLTIAVHGLIGLLGIPMTSILGALSPLLVVIAITGVIHFLTAFVRLQQADEESPLVTAAERVGPGCLWASATTAGGFLSFLWSDLASFRHFGSMAAAGVTLTFLLTFTLLPALLSTRKTLQVGR